MRQFANPEPKPQKRVKEIIIVHFLARHFFFLRISAQGKVRGNMSCVIPQNLTLNQILSPFYCLPKLSNTSGGLEGTRKTCSFVWSFHFWPAELFTGDDVSMVLNFVGAKNW